MFQSWNVKRTIIYKIVLTFDSESDLKYVINNFLLKNESENVSMKKLVCEGKGTRKDYN